jgi:subfamily B ATP-binding cassette protein MsbA
MTPYRRLLSYSFEQWPLLVAAVAGMVVSAATEPAFAALMKPLLDGSFVDRDPETILWVPILLLVIFLARGLSNFVTNYLMAVVGRGVIKRLREKMFTRYLAMPASFFDATASGELISKVSYDAEQVAEAATNSITVLIRDTLTIVGLLAWLFYLNWQMTLGLLVIGPFVTLIVVYVARQFRRVSKRIQGSMGQVTHVTQEMIEGNRVVKIFGGQQYEAEHFDLANEDNRRLHLRLALTKAAASPFVQFFVALALAGMIMFATQPQFHHSVTVGSFMSFLTAMMMLLTPIRRLTNINATIQRGIAAGESIFAVLDAPVEVDNGKEITQQVRGELVFKDVGFTYGTGQSQVLKHISFVAKPGETVALVGRSGSGKSTLVNLVPRFYEVTKGEVRLDDLPLKDLSLVSLRRQIAYVGQHITLFNDSIRNNIAYGDLRNAEDDKIIAAAEAAHAWSFISEMPQGLDTIVGEKGMLLSGGQRQRLAIARAFLKDAPILILDEATASLDTESERHIQQAFETLSKDRTTLVIAHRLSTIENADMILVLDSGEIVESGSHSELLDKKGVYARLYEMQFGRLASEPS